MKRQHIVLEWLTECFWLTQKDGKMFYKLCGDSLPESTANYLTEFTSYKHESLLIHWNRKMDIFVRDNIIHYYLKFYLFFLTVSPSFVSDFLYHETVELFPGHRMNCCLCQAFWRYSSVQVIRMLFIKQQSPDFQVANKLFFLEFI